MSPIVHIGETCWLCHLEGVVPARPVERMTRLVVSRSVPATRDTAGSTPAGGEG